MKPISQQINRLMFLCVTLTFVLSTRFSIVESNPTSFDQVVLPFLKMYCLRCHNEQTQKAEFHIDTLSHSFENNLVTQRWAELINRVNAGEMPPEKELQPTADEIGRVVGWISDRIREGEAVRMAKRGPVVHYRLSRDEYASTVYGLLGVHYDVHMPGSLNEDPRWHGFERIGKMLSLSPSHVSRYFKAAETVLMRAFPEKPIVQNKGQHDANKGREKWLSEQGVSGRFRWVYWPGRVSHHIHIGNQGGQSRVRIQLSGLPSLDDRVPHLTVWDFVLKRSIFDRDIVVPEEEPIIVEFVTSSSSFQIMNDITDAPLPNTHTFNHTSRDFINTKEHRFKNPTGYMLVDDDGNPIYPLLLIDWIEWEVLVASKLELKKRDNLVPSKEGDLDEAHECLKRFADRAWRRPATDTEIDKYVEIVERELVAGEGFRSAHFAAMVGVLTSKNFYYLVEGSATKPRNYIDDWELASRLSYFLWGSIPDEELFTIAKAGRLRDPSVLRGQLTRMLLDPKINRFTESFPRQWLQLYKVGMFPPDSELYPDYDRWLERSMVLETTSFFHEVFSKNLSLHEFLISDWTMVNPRLARHYKMRPLSESGFQRAVLRPEDHRGGLLTQASILMLTSDGTRHRPVHRGVWVSEAIFGKTPPPPPPNVEPLEPTSVNQPKATIRMQLEAHATHAICASCHEKIDPLGFAFDNYDAIGRWRAEEVVTVNQETNPPVNASGTMADGRTYDGPDEFKQLLVQDLDHFAEAFVEQLATFALRRVMTIDDAKQIKEITKASKRDHYKLKTIIENFVMSSLFQKL